MYSYFWTAAVLAVFCASSVSAEQCECEQHSASSKGIGTCTVAENSNKCSIEHSEGDSDEKRVALDFLKSTLGIEIEYRAYDDLHLLSDSRSLESAIAELDFEVASGGDTFLVDLFYGAYSSGDDETVNAAIQAISNRLDNGFGGDDISRITETGCIRIEEDGYLFLVKYWFSYLLVENQKDCVRI